MKSTGMVRKVDELGRIVIPKELRTVLNIDIADSIEVFTEDKTMILRKYNPGCTICGNIKGGQDFKGKYVCEDCLEGMRK